MEQNTENNKAHNSSKSALNNLVSWPPRHTGLDDYVFVYRHPKEGVLVYGRIDAGNYSKELKAKGYKHTATLSAAVILERAANMKSIHDVWEAIHGLDS